MASDLFLGLTIGAATNAAFKSSMSVVGRSLGGLKSATTNLQKEQERLGHAMQQLSAGDALDKLTRQYEKVELAIQKVDRATTKLESAKVGVAAANQKVGESWAGLAKNVLLAYGAYQSVLSTTAPAIEFQDALRDVRITGNLNAEEEQKIGSTVASSVSSTNISRTELLAGVKELVAGGMSSDNTAANIAIMGDTMNALRVSSDVATGAMLSLKDAGIEDSSEMAKSLDILVGIGQKGQFSSEQMLAAFGGLGDTLKATNIAGSQGMAQLAASLQVAEGAMGADAAMAGLQSWITSINDDKIAAAYKNVGVDYQKSMVAMQQLGLNEYQASLEIAANLIKDKLSAKDQQALMAGDKDGRVENMLQTMGLGQVFKDMNAIRFAMSVNNNKAQVNEMAGADYTGSITAIKELRNASPAEMMKRMNLSIQELGIKIGETLLPSLESFVLWVEPIIQSTGTWVKENPELVRQIASIGVGIISAKVAFSALSLVWSSMFAGPLKYLILGVRTAQTAFTLLRVQMLLGFPAITGYMLRIKSLAVLASGGLVSGLKMVTTAVTFLGRALLMNPIGLAITGIALAAYAIYSYWEPIKAFFVGLWERVKTAFDGGISGVCKLILDWSPLGLFYSAFAGVMGWFGVEMPDSFYDFGSNLISGFIDGVKACFSAITNVFSNIWNKITQAFDGGISGVSKLIVDWSPLGLFYSAFSGVMGWFGVEMPDSFYDFGSNLISGFIDGVKACFSAITNVFSSIWNEITQAFDGGISGVSELILNWSPLGLFYSAFAGVLDWFGIELPGKFSEFGSMVIDGLISGITSMFTAVQDTVVGLATSIGDWFCGILGINSPSRVFIENGQWVAEGAAIGIKNSTGDVASAAKGMADAANVDLAGASVSGGARSSNQTSTSVILNFNPTINVQGVDVKAEVQQALKMSLPEFEQMMQRYFAQQQRVAY